MKVGTAGWGYLSRGLREELGLSGPPLEAYAKLFPFVEVNSTFYRLPRVSTARRWLERARSVREDFEFAVKAFRGITHQERFSGKAVELFEETKEVARALEATVILFQTPPSFKPTPHNLERARAFFSSIDREGFTLAWEVRWEKDWPEKVVRELFAELNLVHVVDPLRQRSYWKPLYYRLHGFGKPIYNYTFSEEELRRAAEVVMAQTQGRAYVVFNNYNMYRDALRFAELISRKLP